MNFYKFIDYWCWFGFLPVSGGIACTLSIGNRLLHELIRNKNSKHKKHYEMDQATIKCFDKLYRKSLQDNLMGENDYES